MFLLMTWKLLCFVKQKIAQAAFHHWVLALCAQYVDKCNEIIDIICSVNNCENMFIPLHVDTMFKKN